MEQNRKIIRLDEVDSTNNEAFRLLTNIPDIPEGTVIIADFQNQGKGQTGNTWNSQKGLNLTFSIILHPVFLPLSRQFYLSRIICIAIVKALEQYHQDIKIKWPNDIYSGSKKLGGILIENILMDNKIQNTVVGIGLNINQVEFPLGIPNPTSLKILTGKDFEPNNFLEPITERISTYYNMLKSLDYYNISNEYNEYLLGYKKKLLFKKDGNNFAATIESVEDTGEIILRHIDGSIMNYNFKEVQFDFSINQFKD